MTPTELRNASLRFRKVAPTGRCLTAYEVLVDSRSIGFVWSRRTHSYRGTEGWNRGLRSKDFHPIRWYCGLQLAGPRDATRTSYSRSQAVRDLCDLHERNEGT